MQGSSRNWRFRLLTCTCDQHNQVKSARIHPAACSRSDGTDGAWAKERNRVRHHAHTRTAIQFTRPDPFTTENMSKMQAANRTHIRSTASDELKGQHANTRVSANALFEQGLRVARDALLQEISVRITLKQRQPYAVSQRIRSSTAGGRRRTGRRQRKTDSFMIKTALG